MESSNIHVVGDGEDELVNKEETDNEDACAVGGDEVKDGVLLGHDGGYIENGHVASESDEGVQHVGQQEGHSQVGLVPVRVSGRLEDGTKVVVDDERDHDGRTDYFVMVCPPDDICQERFLGVVKLVLQVADHESEQISHIDDCSQEGEGGEFHNQGQLAYRENCYQHT